MKQEKYPHFNHLVRGIPNNFLTRWMVKKLNSHMKICQSRWEFKIMYRLGKSKKGRKSEYKVHQTEGAIFSLYLVHRSGYEASKARESERIMTEHQRMNAHHNLNNMRGGTYV